MRVALLALAALVLAPAALGAPPALTASASPSRAAGPVAVTLTASGDAAAYAWELGDGARATGPTVRHVYEPGTWVARVTATSATGETSVAEVRVVVLARTVTLAAPAAGDYGGPVELVGMLAPAVPGARVQLYRGAIHVASARTGADGRYRARILLRAPGPYEARYGAARSTSRSIALRPRLVVDAPASIPIAGVAEIRARLEPRAAGSVAIEIRQGTRVVARGTDRVRIPAGRPGLLRITVASKPVRGFGAVRRALSTTVVQPALALGSRGPSVLVLERRLAELRYALRGVDTVYGVDTLEAVTAFQKVSGLPRTGRVDAALWRRLATATTPLPRYGGADHIEVDKTRQVLFEVTGGRVTRIVHVSTGATGNTPLGTWHVYRKVTGFDWVLWYPMYFLRGFAIHGYPSVPAYPASHGCVRVPMWIAPVLFAGHGHGATITIYL